MPVAIITGANSGVGLALAERLLANHKDLRLCMLCRNKGRADAARDALLLAHSGATIDVVIADIGNVKSVKKGAQVIKTLYKRIDYIFLNAGVMPNPKIKFLTVLSTFFQPSHFIRRFSTGADLLEIADGVTDEGFKLTFATNVLGHFCLVNELEEKLGGDQPSQIIWTSSRTAIKEKFHINDIQHAVCEDPYASSKYLTDLLSLAMNEKLRSKKIYTQTVCPGTVYSNMTTGIMPWYIWYALVPVLKSMRILVPSWTWDAYNGAESHVWLTEQNVLELDPKAKYFSSVTAFGYPYVDQRKMEITLEESLQAYDEMMKILKTCG